MNREAHGPYAAEAQWGRSLSPASVKPLSLLLTPHPAPSPGRPLDPQDEVRAQGLLVGGMETVLSNWYGDHSCGSAPGHSTHLSPSLRGDTMGEREPKGPWQSMQGYNLLCACTHGHQRCWGKQADGVHLFPSPAHRPLIFRPLHLSVRVSF